MRKSTLLLAAILVVWVIAVLVASNLQHQLHTKPAKDEEVAAIAKAANVAIVLKRAMRDPDSFKLSSVMIVDKTDAICYEYRSRNGFGGMNVGQAVLSSKGSFMTNDMDGFHALWKSECSGKMGRDHAVAVTFLLDHPTS